MKKPRVVGERHPAPAGANPCAVLPQQPLCSWRDAAAKRLFPCPAKAPDRNGWEDAVMAPALRHDGRIPGVRYRTEPVLRAVNTFCARLRTYGI